jgi:hypothetical protein
MSVETQHKQRVTRASCSPPSSGVLKIVKNHSYSQLSHAGPSFVEFAFSRLVILIYICFNKMSTVPTTSSSSASSVAALSSPPHATHSPNPTLPPLPSPPPATQFSCSSLGNALAGMIDQKDIESLLHLQTRTYALSARKRPHVKCRIEDERVYRRADLRTATNTLASFNDRSLRRSQIFT